MRSHEPESREILHRASPEEQARYLELMRHDPVVGTAYLDALEIQQQWQTGD